MIFKKKESHIKFADTTRLAYHVNPIELAKDVPSHFQKSQINEYGKFMFPSCPGTMDYKKYGYIIPAWDDINILADKTGSLVILGGDPMRKSPFSKPKKMNDKLMKGVYNPTGDIKFEIWHLGAPWSIHVSKDISAFLMPAFYHSDFLDDLYVYPGIVDYSEKFTTINFIFSAKRPCKLTIKAGTPLLHVIPFKPDTIRASFGPADDYEIDRSKSIVSNAKQFYRKYITHDKPTDLEIK